MPGISRRLHRISDYTRVLINCFFFSLGWISSSYFFNFSFKIFYYNDDDNNKIFYLKRKIVETFVTKMLLFITYFSFVYLILNIENTNSNRSIWVAINIFKIIKLQTLNFFSFVIALCSKFTHNYRKLKKYSLIVNFNILNSFARANHLYGSMKNVIKTSSFLIIEKIVVPWKSSSRYCE